MPSIGFMAMTTVIAWGRKFGKFLAEWHSVRILSTQLYQSLNFKFLGQTVDTVQHACCDSFREEAQLRTQIVELLHVWSIPNL